MRAFVLWNQSRQNFACIPKFLCEVIYFKDVSNSFPVQVWVDYIVIMPGFAFLILSVAKSLTTDGPGAPVGYWRGGIRWGRPKFNCDWQKPVHSPLNEGGGSNLKMSRWHQCMLTMESHHHPQHNSDLSDIHVYTNCIWICGVSGISADYAKSFCQTKSCQISYYATIQLSY